MDRPDLFRVDGRLPHSGLAFQVVTLTALMAFCAADEADALVPYLVDQGMAPDQAEERAQRLARVAHSVTRLGGQRRVSARDLCELHVDDLTALLAARTEVVRCEEAFRARWARAAASSAAAGQDHGVDGRGHPDAA